MRNGLPIVAIAVSLMLAACQPAATDDAAATPDAATPAEAREPAATTADAGNRQALLKQRLQGLVEQRTRWWNDAKIAQSVGIDAEQQQAMNDLRNAWQQDEEQRKAENRAARQEFHAALRADDLARARIAAQRRAELAAQVSLSRQNLSLELLQVLDSTQRATVLDRFARQLTGDLRSGPGSRSGTREQRRDGN
jgi:hypothetical protein